VLIRFSIEAFAHDLTKPFFHCRDQKRKSLKSKALNNKALANRCLILDLTEITAIVTTVSIVVGVIFTLMEIRHFNKTRKTEIIMKIYEKFGSKEMVEATMKVGSAQFENLDDYRKKYGFNEVTQLAVLFEGLGVLLDENLIDIKMVDSLFGPTLNQLWQKMEPVIQAMRIGLKEPFFFSHYESLINKLNSYRQTMKA